MVTRAKHTFAWDFRLGPWSRPFPLLGILPPPPQISTSVTSHLVQASA